METTENSIEKALRILLYLSSASDGAPVSEISAALGYPTYNVVRILKTLKGMGFVWQEKARSPYKIGYRVLELAGNLLEGMELRQSARPFLHTLATDTGMTSYLKVKTGYEVITVDVVVPPRASAASDEIGRRLPLHASSPGKAILAARGEDEAREYIEQHGLNPVTSHTITDPEAFLAEIRVTRERGYAINQEESGPVISIAAPILRYDGKPVAAVAVSVAARPGILGAERKQAVAHDVREAARRISFSVGYAANQLV
jgi:DNA-binding IclR family transcriptional regulator